MVNRFLIVAVTTIGWLGCSADNDVANVSVLEDMEFLAFVDLDTDEQPRTIRLSDYYADSRPGTEILMLNAAAGWCAPCMREASAMPAFAATYQPQGVAILTAVFQDQNGDPADAEFVRIWAETFGLPVPALIDSDFQTGRYFDVSTMPANMFVNAATLEILAIATGADTGDDPMQEYRELLDYYLH